MNLVKEFNNKLLKRKEVEVSQKYGGNPGLALVLKDVAVHFKVQEDLVVIKRINSQFGSDSFLIQAFVYDSVKDKERIEPKKKEKKKVGGK